MLISTRRHGLLFATLLAAAGCGDDTAAGSRGGGGGGGTSSETTNPTGNPTGATEDVTVCLDREDLWASVLLTEASGTAVSVGTGGAGGASGSGGAGGGGGAGGAPAIPEGCPEAARAEEQVFAAAGSGPRNGIEEPTLEGTNCCYVANGSAAVAGRPLRQGGRQLVARASAALSPDAAADVATHWLRMAELEHASIASFAKLSLDLLAVGAPIELVADAQRAGVEEARHTELALGLAARFGGERAQVGALGALAGCRVELDVAQIVRETLRDGCVNESFASFEAAEQAARCEDPAVREALDTIARDEAGHAALAFRIVRWALDAGLVEPRLVEVELEQAIAELTSIRSEGRSDLEARGILAPDTRDAVARHVAARLRARGSAWSGVERAA